ncbi:MAG: hypothetical protein CMI60_00920 [Parvibaculum sp.]|nr:hypothetical protein [Parvibaculum sp.]
MNRTENNKLIAQFMGLPTEVFKSGKVKYYYREFNSGMYDPETNWYEEHELSYNVSWDWLMPVVEKIEEVFIDDSNLIIKEHRYEFDMKYTQCEIYDHVRDCVVASGDMGSKILSTYQSVVEFIKEYNN